MIDTVSIIRLSRWAVGDKVHRMSKVGPDHAAKERLCLRPALPHFGNAVVLTASILAPSPRPSPLPGKREFR